MSLDNALKAMKNLTDIKDIAELQKETKQHYNAVCKMDNAYNVGEFIYCHDGTNQKISKGVCLKVNPKSVKVVFICPSVSPHTVSSGKKPNKKGYQMYVYSYTGEWKLMGYDAVVVNIKKEFVVDPPKSDKDVRYNWYRYKEITEDEKALIKNKGEKSMHGYHVSTDYNDSDIWTPALLSIAIERVKRLPIVTVGYMTKTEQVLTHLDGNEHHWEKLQTEVIDILYESLLHGGITA
jgi:hypothetical protein